MLDNTLVERLIDVLGKEAAVYEDILKISKNKTNIIVEGKVSELESLVKLEQSLVLQMGKLEGLREELVDKISTELHIETGKITISMLTALVDTEVKGKLKNCQGRLENVLLELKGKNELNAKLIKNSLDYIDFSVNIMSSIAATGNNYGDTGNVSEGGKRRLFDVKL